MGTRKRTDKNDSVKEFYVEFMKLPTPASRRSADLPYATKQEFCTHWHIDRSTVWRWEQDPEFMRTVHNDILGVLSIPEVQKIINAQKIRAFDGNTIAAKFLLEWAGVTGPKATKPLGPDLEQERHDISKLSDEELQRYLEEEDLLELAGGSEEDHGDGEDTDTE